MKTRPRIRRATLWGGVVVSALLAALWIGSMVWFVEWRAPGLIHVVGIGHGAAGMSKSDSGWGGSASKPGLRSGMAYGPMACWLNAHDDGRNWWVWVPLWMPLVVSLGVTGAAWRLEVLARRRQRAGKCASCGYDRAGLKVGAVCPECGAAHGFVSENR